MTTLQAIPSGPAKCIRGVWSRQKEMPVIPNGVAAGQPHWAQPGLVANDTMSQAMLLHRHHSVALGDDSRTSQGGLPGLLEVVLHHTAWKNPYRELYCIVSRINRSPKETQEKGVEFSPAVAIYLSTWTRKITTTPQIRS